MNRKGARLAKSRDTIIRKNGIWMYLVNRRLTENPTAGWKTCLIALRKRPASQDSTNVMKYDQISRSISRRCENAGAGQGTAPSCAGRKRATGSHRAFLPWRTWACLQRLRSRSLPKSVLVHRGRLRVNIHCGNNLFRLIKMPKHFVGQLPCRDL